MLLVRQHFTGSTSPHCLTTCHASVPLPAACREMASTADIVFMPYNYLIDAKTRGGLGIQWANAVLIFDEAHNVEVGGCDCCFVSWKDRARQGCDWDD